MNTSGSSFGMFKTENPHIDSMKMNVLHCVKPLKKSE